MKSKLHLKRLLNNQQGIALVVVLLVMTVITIMGVTLLALAADNVKMSTGERSYQSTYYVAESGITYRINEISAKLKDVYGQATSLTDFFAQVDDKMQLGQPVTYNNFEKTFGQQPTATITIEKVSSDVLISYSKDYKITSTGTINNRSRTVTSIFHVAWKPKSVVKIPASTVMFFYSAFTLHNAPVDGTLGTNLVQGDNKISMTGKNTRGIPINYDLKSPQTLPPFPDFSLSANPDVLDKVVTPGDTPQEKTLTMKRDMSFDTLTVTAGTTLTIDVGNVNRNIAVNNLTCNGTIKIVGSGKLSLYVNNLTMGTNLNGAKSYISGYRYDETTKSYVNSIEKLYIFCKGIGSILNNGIIYGSMYAINVPSFNVSATDGVQGHLIVGKPASSSSVTTIALNGNAITTPKMIYAPFAEVDLNASFQGSIIADKIISSGNDDNFLYKYVQIDYDSSPLFVDNGSGFSPVEDMIMTEPVREIN
jgi:Tfp pilus assembly protein PilX